jgi:hypothetical protein
MSLTEWGSEDAQRLILHEEKTGALGAQARSARTISRYCILGKAVKKLNVCQIGIYIEQ